MKPQNSTVYVRRIQSIKYINEGEKAASLTSTTATYRFAFADSVCVCVCGCFSSTPRKCVCAFVYVHRTIQMWVCVYINKAIGFKTKTRENWMIFPLKNELFRAKFRWCMRFMLWWSERKRQRKRERERDVRSGNCESICWVYVCMFVLLNVLAKMRENLNQEFFYKQKAQHLLLLATEEKILCKRFSCFEMLVRV